MNLRRLILAALLGAAAMAPPAQVLAAGQTAGESASAREIDARIKRVLARTPLIDGHNDWAWAMHEKYGDAAMTLDLDRDLSHAEKPLHTDIVRLRSGQAGGLFWSVWIPPEVKGADAIAETLRQIDLARTTIARYPQTFEMAGSADDIERIHRKGRIASMIGVEGGGQIGGSLAALRAYHALGARYLTLTHMLSTDWADAATDAPRHHGIAPFGVEVIRELNRLGMLVDLAHVSADTMRAAIATSRAPVIFSHSGARGATAHARNVPDDVLQLIAKCDGVVMVPFVAAYISEEFRRWKAAQAAEMTRLTGAPYDGLHLDDPEGAEAAMAAWRQTHPMPQVTIGQVADHIDYIRRNAGIDHVGIGSDFDGTLILPQGLQGVDTFPALLRELARRGWSDQDLAKVAGGNILRVLRKAEDVAVEMRANAPVAQSCGATRTASTRMPGMVWASPGPSW